MSLPSKEECHAVALAVNKLLDAADELQAVMRENRNVGGFIKLIVSADSVPRDTVLTGFSLTGVGWNGLRWVLYD